MNPTPLPTRGEIFHAYTEYNDVDDDDDDDDDNDEVMFLDSKCAQFNCH